MLLPQFYSPTPAVYLLTADSKESRPLSILLWRGPGGGRCHSGAVDGRVMIIPTATRSRKAPPARHRFPSVIGGRGGGREKLSVNPSVCFPRFLVRTSSSDIISAQNARTYYCSPQRDTDYNVLCSQFSLHV